VDGPGYYGKLPARGDFLGRRLSRPFIRDWDMWLQHGMAASQDMLGARWLEFYLVSPLWRFLLPAASCGPNPVAGVMMPSVDGVNRYFPLVVGREFAPESDIIDFLSRSALWYEKVEDLALSALAPEFKLEAFDRPLALDPVTPSETPPPESAPAPPVVAPIVMDLPAPDRLAGVIGAFPAGPSPNTFWWTIGSEHVAPCLFVSPGMPPAERFAAFLNGEWDLAGPPPAENAAPTVQTAQDAPQS
jgi:type VI secretion system protein ImpM